MDNLFFAAVEVTRMPMIVIDPNRPDSSIVFANEALFQMTGYGPDDVVGLNCRFLQGPETSREAIAEVKSATEQRTQIAVDVLNYRRDCHSAQRSGSAKARGPATESHPRVRAAAIAASS